MESYNAYTVYASVKLAPYLGSKATKIGGVDVIRGSSTQAIVYIRNNSRKNMKTIN